MHLGAVTIVSLAAALVSTAAAFAVPPTHAVHERRHVPHPRINKRLPAQAVLPMRIGLKQNAAALQLAEEWLMEVSHPSSEKYGQHWTSDEVIATFSPSNETVDAVAGWLIDAGISPERITRSGNQAWFAFDATVNEAEQLLHTEYFHDGVDGGRGSKVGCNQYHLPKHVQDHVDYVTPGLKSSILDLRHLSLKKRSTSSKPGVSKSLSHRKRHEKLKKIVATSHVANLNTSSLDTCDEVITPACLRALYSFDAPSTNATVSANNSLGIFEEGDFYGQEDFNNFFQKYTPYIPNGTHPTLDSVDGGEAPVATADDGVGNPFHHVTEPHPVLSLS